MRIQVETVHLSLKYNALLAKDYYPALRACSVAKTICHPAPRRVQWSTLSVLESTNLRICFCCNYVMTIFNVIYQARATSQRDIQTLRKELKWIRLAVEYFWLNTRCFDSRWNTASSVWYIFSIETKTKSKWRTKIVKIHVNYDRVSKPPSRLWFSLF